MPICFRPDRKIPVVLTCDKEQDNPPTFYHRPLTAAQVMDTAELFDRIKVEAKTGKEAIQKVFDYLATIIVDWQNMPEPFDANKLVHVLTIGEAQELLKAVMAGSSLGEVDRGK